MDAGKMTLQELMNALQSKEQRRLMRKDEENSKTIEGELIWWRLQPQNVK